MKKLLLIIGIIFCVWKLAHSQAVVVPGSSFPVTNSPPVWARLLMVDTNGGASSSSLTKSNMTIRWDTLTNTTTALASDVAQNKVNGTSNLLANLSGGFVTLITNGSSTAVIQSTLNSITNGGVVSVQPGSYTITSSLVITNGFSIQGNGATFAFTPSQTNFMVDTTTNYGKTLLIDNLVFDGGVYDTYNDTNHFQTITSGQHDPFKNVCYTNHGGLRVEASGGVRIQNCTFRGWSGAACLALQADGTLNAQNRPKFEFLFNRCYTNFIGVNAIVSSWEVPGYFNPDSSTWLASSAPEYCLIEGNDVFNNQYGIVASAGNSLVQGNTVNGNWLGLSAFSGVNGQHGKYCGNTLNHNMIAIYFQGGGIGGLFQDNVLLANGSIVFNAVTDFLLKNNNVGQTALYATNGASGIISFNTYQATAIWGGSNSLTGIFTNFTANIQAQGNVSTDGTNNDGSVISATMRFNGLTSPSNLPPTAADYKGQMFYWNSNGANIYLIKSSSGGTAWTTTNLIN